MSYADTIMNTYDIIAKLSTSAQEKISTGEHHIHRVGEIQCITIPFQYYLMLEECKIIAKSRKKK